MSTVQSPFQVAAMPTEKLCERAIQTWEQDISGSLDETQQRTFEPLFGTLVSRLRGKVESEHNIWSGQQSRNNY